MSGPITTGSHPRLMWPGVKAFFGQKYNDHNKEYPFLFDIDYSDQNYELDVELSSFPLAPVKDQNGSVTYASLTQGYTTTYRHIAYALGYIVTYEEISDNLYPSVSKKRAGALARALHQTRETVGANIYNRAFNSSYVGGDGKELLATDHPSRAGTWQNELTTAADISETSVEDLCILVMNAVDNDGKKASLMPKSLLVPTAQWWEANRIMKSTLQNDTADNAINVLKTVNAFPEGIKMSHYFTDTDAWFIRTDCPRGLVHYERDIKELEMDNDFDTSNAKAKKYERYSFNWTDPRGLYGSAGA